VTSHLVDWMSASIDEGPAGPTDEQTHANASHDARHGRDRLGNGRCGGGESQPGPLTSTTGDGCRQLIWPPCRAFGRNKVAVIGR
jgi:hypothetical protein